MRCRGGLAGYGLLGLLLGVVGCGEDTVGEVSSSNNHVEMGGSADPSEFGEASESGETSESEEASESGEASDSNVAAEQTASAGQEVADEPKVVVAIAESAPAGVADSSSSKESALPSEQTGQGGSSAESPAASGGRSRCGAPPEKMLPEGAFACDYFCPEHGYITDFTEESYFGGEWGMDLGVWGDSYEYVDASAEPLQMDWSPEEGILHLQGIVVNYSGWGLAFSRCSDAGHFDGMKLELSGSFEGTLSVLLQTNSNFPISPEAERGACVFSSEDEKWSECRNASAELTAEDFETGFKTLLWDDFSGGSPEYRVDSSELLGIQLQWNCPGETCQVDVLLEEVSFYLVR